MCKNTAKYHTKRENKKIEFSYSDQLMRILAQGLVRYALVCKTIAKNDI